MTCVFQKNPLDKWTLDSTEGPHRMRKKTMRNDQFYSQYIYRPELEDPENVSAILISSLSEFSKIESDTNNYFKTHSVSSNIR